MANELLDFVMSLVRDPDAAARYADDPQQAIADAHLTDVSSADVNNLIPVVSESLSMASPALGGGLAGDENIWSSGAATAAFDAFSDTLHTPVVADAHDFVLDQPGVAPLDTGVEQLSDLGPDLQTLDVGTFDDTFAPTDVPVHDVAAALDVEDLGDLDSGFGHLPDHPVF